MLVTAVVSTVVLAHRSATPSGAVDSSDATWTISGEGPATQTWNQVAEHLGQLQPGERWSAKRAEHVMTAVRQRLAGGGVIGLTRAEVGEPIGNTINHNLMTELLLSTTLVPPDLRLLEGSAEWP